MATEFVYPPGGNFSTANDDRYLNVFDDLYIEYTSSYTSLNITLFCLRTTTSTAYQVFNAEDNPLTGSGMYHFGSIQSHNVEIYQFPSRCHFKLTDSGNNDDALSGEGFEVSSDAASSTTFSPSSSSTSTATSTSASSGTVASVQATTTDATTAAPTSSSSSSSSSSTLSSSPTATASQASSTPQPSVGLSTAAAAGIGVGAAAVVLVLAAMLFMFFRKRRKTATAGPDMSPESTPSAATKFESYQPQYETPSAQEMSTERPAAELGFGQFDPSNRHELGATSHRHELPS
ncbi:hypothetical protein BJ166DRAFT_598109 [Pestalotiopsis sp. NC0098]|nr:hypothetical protein BJ166DRAFT_598109 [Pestalotiopsis sp. NC0098]